MRYVILWHELPADSDRSSHWDLMLETSPDDRLITWALDGEPLPGSRTWARQLAPHRRVYLDYEGPITGGRGHVTQWDAGQYTQQETGAGRWQITLFGTRLRDVPLVLQQASDGSDCYSVDIGHAPD